MGQAHCAGGRPRLRGRGWGLMAALMAVLVFLSQRGQCAPQGSSRSDAQPEAPASTGTLENPFGTGDEERRLLQSYILDRLKEGQGSPDHMTREQEIFYLYSLHDYDKSGQLDGLELMALLSDFLSHQDPAQQSAESVISTVDVLLQTQDLNQDGLLDPSELLSPASERHAAPLDVDEQAQAPETGMDADTGAPEEQGAQEPPSPQPKNEEEESVPQEEPQPHLEAPEPPGTNHDSQFQQQLELQNPDGEVLEQHHEQPAHQGQSEM
ncbi:CGRE1 protein, partial [Amia calva]|nr:CGRE1 protein [Amia calva]